jgi:hypothetical protein
LGYYKDRIYKGTVATYNHGDSNGDIAIPKTITTNTKENDRYYSNNSEWDINNIFRNETYVSSKDVTPKEGGSKGITTHRDFQKDDGMIGKESLSRVIDKINSSFGIQNNNETLKSTISKEMKFYNRFKVPELNVQMSRCYGHVFFTRPSCNILTSNRNLADSVANNPIYLYAYRTCRDLLSEMSIYGPNSSGDEFNMLLSNNSKGFALNDETLSTSSYGTTFSGYKISYGKDDIDSKVGGEFNTTFIDDKRIHCYRFIKLWVEYITGVYRGRISPRIDDELQKVIDYVSSVYYILTAEDGETIIFWSKYFGVYPTTIPSSQYSWQHGENLSPSEIQVSFSYSWKQDFDPRDLVAFNYNAKLGTDNYKYSRIYDTDLLMNGPIWVGTPFIEFVDDGVNEPCYKLRFRKFTS